MVILGGSRDGGGGTASSPDVLIVGAGVMGAATACFLARDHGDVALAVEAMQNGARDFIEKPGTFATIIAKIEAAMISSKPLVEKSHSASEARDLIASLTKREHEVMRLACDGMRNKEIADTLNLGVRTVESYRHQAIQKLGESKLINIAKIFQAAQGS